MKKAFLITATAVVAIATPTSIYAIKRLDTSSTAPSITSNSEDWTKTATIVATTDATFGGSGLDHYEYCISSTDTTDNCEWKISSVNAIRVRNLGTSYIWLRGVSEYGVISDISNYAITRIDRTKPEATAEITTTTSSINVAIAATDDSGIKGYEYSINDSEYIADSENHTFDELSAGTTYRIKIKITDLAGNTKYLSYDATTVSIILINRNNRVANRSNRNVQIANNAKAEERKKLERNEQGRKNEEMVEEVSDNNTEDTLDDEELTNINEDGEQESGETVADDTESAKSAEESIICEDDDDSSEVEDNEETASYQTELVDDLESVEADNSESSDNSQDNCSTTEENENSDSSQDDCSVPEENEESDSIIDDNDEDNDASDVILSEI